MRDGLAGLLRPDTIAVELHLVPQPSPAGTALAGEGAAGE